MKIQSNRRALRQTLSISCLMLMLAASGLRAQQPITGSDAGISGARGQRGLGVAAAMPANVATKKVNIYSEGTRLSADLIYPKDMKPTDKLPAIVMSHGWGGTRAQLSRTYGPKFAAAGFVVLSFDYRGWGDSDSKLVIQGPMPRPDEKQEVTVKAQAIRTVVDPFDQTFDIMNAIDFIQGEPGVDPEKIGIWGTSYSGGHVVYVAGNDPRVKCVVSQVGPMNSTLTVEPFYGNKGGLKYAHDQAVKRARGEISPLPLAGEDKAEGLTGWAHLSKIAKYRPIDFAKNITVPTLLIVAEKEELFDNKEHAAKVYDILKANNVPSKYIIIPGITHYGIYSEKYEEGSNLALDWFKQYLMGEKK